MSDRRKLIDMVTRIRKRDSSAESVQLFMDGESGTWRLFVLDGDGCRSVDFTLSALQTFAEELDFALAQIRNDPDGYNAELRLKTLAQHEANEE